MNLQDELSQSARLPEEVAEEENRKKDQLAQKNAERSASEITASIKAMLLENVRQGKYAKQYNKGTAECYFEISDNRYLKLKTLSYYNRKHIRTDLRHKFCIEPQYAAEYDYIRNILEVWGNENQVSITWVVREEGRLGEYAFPGTEYHSFPPYSYDRRLRLAVKAVTHFPVNPSLPMNYMSADDVADKKREIQLRIERKKSHCANKKKEVITLSMTFALFVILAVACLISEIYVLTFLELVMGILFGIGAYVSYGEYRSAKASLESEIKNGK